MTFGKERTFIIDAQTEMAVYGSSRLAVSFGVTAEVRLDVYATRTTGFLPCTCVDEQDGHSFKQHVKGIARE